MTSSFQSATTAVSSHAKGTTSMTSTSSLPNTAATITPAFHYIQLYGNSLYEYTAAEVNDAPFSDLCPGGNCVTACQDYGLLFNKDYYEFSPTATLDTSFSNDSITLFGLCTNVANITSAITNTNSLPNATDFFRNRDSDSDDVHKIVSGTAQCLFGTCQAMRKPYECIPFCSTSVLQESLSTLNFKNAYKCMAKLCDYSAGLPYADEDVFGIGVLISFAIQALIILLYAAFCLIRTYDPAKVGRKMERVKDKLNDAAGTFLVAECFFAVSAVIAAFRLSPQGIDAFHGYALLFIATIGFIPPIFTLMLLHSQGKSEWYHTFLVLLSWVLSSALFFVLIRNLQDVRYSAQGVADVRNAMYQVDACGGYSAMSLCRETSMIDPLYFIMRFYDQDSIPSFVDIPALWVFATIVLIILLARKVLDRRRKITRTTRKVSTLTKYGEPFRNVVKPLRRGLLPLTVIFFILCFSYQLGMVSRYVEMNLIPGWDFAQIVAVLLWAPIIFELIFGSFLAYLKKRFDTKLNGSDAGADDNSTHKPPGKSVVSGASSAQTRPGYQAVPSSPIPMSTLTPTPAPTLTPLLLSPPLNTTGPAPQSPVSAPSSPQLGSQLPVSAV